jgi:hypothetical protein
MQWSSKFNATADDFTFLESDHRSNDFNLGFGTRAFANELLECAVIFGAAIGISGTIFRYRSYVNGTRTDRFGPTDRDG